MNRRIPLLLVVIPLIFLLLGCGKKANPIAPEESIPAPVSDLQAWGKEEGIYLRWSMPSKNLDGSRIGDLLWFRVFRQERALGPSSCPDCPPRFEAVGEIDVEFPRGPVQIDGGTVLWWDRNVKAQNRYLYFVVAYNAYKTPSPESNRASMAWDQPPALPEKPRVRSEDGALELSWSYPPLRAGGKEMEDLAGFNLYRRSEGERFGFFPLNPQPVPGREYLDGALENGKRYFYQVRAVRNFHGTLIEGAGSPPVSGVPEKRTPPSPPTGLIGVRQEDGIALRWNANPETDIAGYQVFRRESGERELRKITPGLITELSLVDKTADPRRSYEYSLKAVNSAGRESGFSQTIEVVPER